MRLLKDPLCLFKLQPVGHWTLHYSPCWSALNFWKMDFDELHFWSTLNLNFAGYTSSKNQGRNRPKMEFVEIHFSKSIFQKSSADQQGVWNPHYDKMYWDLGYPEETRNVGKKGNSLLCILPKKMDKKVNIKQRKKYHKT